MADNNLSHVHGTPMPKGKATVNVVKMDVYHDINGRPTTLISLCRKDPEWAARRIRGLVKSGEEKAEENKKLWAILGEGGAALLKQNAALVETIHSLPMGLDFICSNCGKDLQEVELFSIVPVGGRNSGRTFCGDCWQKERDHGND